MPDWNPDREGHATHKWLVQKANLFGNLNDDVLTSKGALKTSQKGRFFVNDPALAAEIRSEYPKDYTVTRVRYPDPADKGHKYFHGLWPEMPWKKREEEETQDDATTVKEGEHEESNSNQ